MLLRIFTARAHACFSHAGTGTSFLYGNIPKLSSELIRFAHASCSHAICMCDISRTCLQCVRTCEACFKSSVLAGAKLAGVRHLWHSEGAGRACNHNGANKRLSLVRSTCKTASRGRHVQVHMPPPEALVFHFRRYASLWMLCAICASCFLCSLLGGRPIPEPVHRCFPHRCNRTACLFGGRITAARSRPRSPRHWPIRGHPP